ncbi:MAG: NAD(P)H-dependent oxidoreductase subunit E [Desulfobulbaceae bacterium]|nr:MAG: NAD(P)H-dependent oxidoreductase subunit E [Desulfobulbaceae bacterium]
MQKKTYQDLLLKYHQEKGTVLTLLQDLQQEFGYIPEAAVFWLAAQTNIPASRFYGVTTYFKQFRLKPRGRHTVKICGGAACHVKGAVAISKRIRADLGLSAEDDTTADGLFTIESAGCAGVCNEAAVLSIDDQIYGGLTPDGAIKILTSRQGVG